MKTSNRARRNGGKKASSAQSAKSTQALPEKPVVETKDIYWLTVWAVQRILKTNETPHGLTAEFISGLLPTFGCQATPEDVSLMLLGMENLGVVNHAGEHWKPNLPVMAASTVIQSLGTIPSKMEETNQRVGAVLELLRCKLIAEGEGIGLFGSPFYDEIKSQRLCGLISLIHGAEKSIDDTYLAVVKLAKEFHQAAGMPV